MKKRTRPAVFPLCPFPVALLAFRSIGGQDQVMAIGWVGVICSSPAIISVSLRKQFHVRGGLPRGNDFSINLPREELLGSLAFRSLVQREEIRFPVGSGLSLQNGAVIKGPLLAGCQVVIECSRATVSSRFGEQVVSGEVAALHLDGKIYGPERMPDLSRLKPFSRSLSRTPVSEPVAGRTLS